MLVPGLLEMAAHRRPEATAVVHGDASVTFADLFNRSAALAAQLSDRGMTPGDRVALSFNKSIHSIVAMFGVWRAGGVVVNLNAAHPPGKRWQVVEDCSPFCVLGEPSLLISLKELVQASDARQYPFLVLGREGHDDACSRIHMIDVDAPISGRPGPRRISQDLAAIIYTSGSTGRQKGVMLSHLNLVDHVRSVTTYLENTEEDRLISVLPFTFGYGLSQLLTAVGAGAQLTLVESGAFPNEILDVLESDGLTGMAGVPSHFRMLNEYGDIESRNLSALRYITISGAKAPASLVQEIRRTLPHVSVFLMFGQTESTIRSCYLEPDEVDRRPESIGKPMPNVDVMLLDEEGQLIHGAGEGEFVCRGTNVMMGYWNDPQLTDKVLRPHPNPDGGSSQESVLHTGDIVRRDEEGFLYFVGRVDDMIKNGAHRIFPAEIEAVIQEHASIREVAVIGEFDELLGSVPIAFVAGSEISVSEILRLCRDRLPRYMVPKRVHVTDRLPRTSNGKILKSQLGRVSAGVSL